MDRSKQYETVLVIVLGCIVGYLLSHARWWLPAALVIGLVSVLVPAVAGGIAVVWTKLSRLLGEVSGRVLLTVVYVLLLVPLALLARLTGHAGLRRKRAGGSYFTERNHRYEKEDMINPW
jgi:hypothetical protein